MGHPVYRLRAVVDAPLEPCADDGHQARLRWAAITLDAYRLVVVDHLDEGFFDAKGIVVEGAMPAADEAGAVRSCVERITKRASLQI